MLDHLGEAGMAERIRSSIRSVLDRREVRTPDLGGDATTEEFADALIAEVESGAVRV
jgi:tartrate dehydrogenase/decarboxylase/D-malate dehydrogenase